MRTFIPLSTLMSQGRPDAYPVCYSVDSTITWRTFSNSIRALAYGLSLRAEARWLISSQNALEFTIQLMALLHAGKQVVIPPNLQSGTRADLASEFDAVVSNDIASVADDAFVLSPLAAQTSFIDVYTSGSTGRPKRVRKTLTQFETEIETLECLWGDVLGDSAIVATVPHHHIYGLIFRIFWPLSAGRALDAVLCTDPEMLNNRLTRLNKAAIVSSPALLSRLPELAPLISIIPSTTLIFSSGGALSKVAALQFQQQLSNTPIEVFGSTETGGIAWRRQLNDEAWLPFAGIQLKCNEDVATLSSPFLADGLPKTMDDAIELLPDGRFHLLGRVDRVVKIEEKRLSLPEMELQLVRHAWVNSAVAIALSSRRQMVGAAIELTAEGQHMLMQHGRRMVTQQLKTHLAQYFDAVLLPRHWRFVDQLPMSAHGKLTYAAITALFTSEGSQHAVP
jgi:acyl-coenzyme A synthetase/AMP-(fatty) acid ligase